MNKAREWLGDAGEAKLGDWDISRDAPYFGFEIPGAPGKYFYVWLDAPVGYYASFKNLAEKRGLDFDSWIRKGSTAEQYHFIGKDICTSTRCSGRRCSSSRASVARRPTCSRTAS